VSEDRDGPERGGTTSNIEVRRPTNGRGASVPEDAIFDVLSNRRRRYVLHLLEGRPGTVDLGGMAEQIAAWENGIPVGEVDGNQRKRVYTALQQTHLPKMDEAGLVAFDKDRGHVERTDALDDVDIYLDVVRGGDIPWSQYYLWLSGLSAVVLAAVWVGIWPFVLLPGSGWFAFVVVAFLASSIAHWYYTKDAKVGTNREPPELGL